MKIILLYLMALFYVAAGLNHFRKPKFYRPMIPPYLPWPKTLVAASGLAEIILGLLLLSPVTRTLAAYGIIAMLLVFMIVHIYMYQTRKTVFATVPPWIIILRIPFQGVLMAWAYWYVN